MKLSWNDAGTRIYETGVNKAALYPVDSTGSYGEGIAWNGVISVNASPSGGEVSPVYANNVKIAEIESVVSYGGQIEAYTKPEEFSYCDGMETGIPGLSISPVMKRRRFGLVYRTEIGNDLQDLDFGYRLHIHYGCIATSSEQSYATLNESPELTRFRWTFTSIPTKITGFDSSSYICLDSHRVGVANMNLLEDILYGTQWTEPRLPYPDEIFDIVEDHDDTWIGGIFAVIPDDTEFPFNGTYQDYVMGFYKNLDLRSF